MSPLRTFVRGSDRPSKGSIWRRAMSRPAAVPKPTMTEWETKLTMKPSRSSPSPTCSTPAMTASTPAATMYSCEPGRAETARVEKTSSDRVLVGPVWRCSDEPQSAATMPPMTAVYRPICGGSWASNEKAMA